MTKTQSMRAKFSSKLSVLEVIFINKKGFCTRVQECGFNLETARLKSLQKGQVLRPFIPIKYIHNKFRELDSLAKNQSIPNHLILFSDLYPACTN